MRLSNSERAGDSGHRQVTLSVLVLLLSALWFEYWITAFLPQMVAATMHWYFPGGRQVPAASAFDQPSGILRLFPAEHATTVAGVAGVGLELVAVALAVRRRRGLGGSCGVGTALLRSTVLYSLLGIAVSRAGGWISIVLLEKRLFEFLGDAAKEPGDRAHLMLAGQINELTVASARWVTITSVVATGILMYALFLSKGGFNARWPRALLLAGSSLLGIVAWRWGLSGILDLMPQAWMSLSSGVEWSGGVSRLRAGLGVSFGALVVAALVVGARGLEPETLPSARINRALCVWLPLATGFLLITLAVPFRHASTADLMRPRERTREVFVRGRVAVLGESAVEPSVLKDLLCESETNGASARAEPVHIKALSSADWGEVQVFLESVYAGGIREVRFEEDYVEEKTCPFIGRLRGIRYRWIPVRLSAGGNEITEFKTFGEAQRAAVAMYHQGSALTVTVAGGAPCHPATRVAP